MYQDKRKEQADKMNYFDCHVDTLTEILKPGDTLDENSCNLDLKRVGNFVENYTQIFAIWKDAVKLDKEEPDRDFFRLYDRAMAYLAEENRKIALCLTGEEMEKAHRQRKAAAFLSIEDLSIMGKYVEKIREMGFRFAMLTWNYENEYACSRRSGQGSDCQRKRNGKSPDGSGNRDGYFPSVRSGSGRSVSIDRQTGHGFSL